MSFAPTPMGETVLEPPPLTGYHFGRGIVEYEREPMKQERFAAVVNAVYIALGGGLFVTFCALFCGAIGG